MKWVSQGESLSIVRRNIYVNFYKSVRFLIACAAAHNSRPLLTRIHMCTQRTVKWAGHASLLWELHEQELSNMGHTRRQRDKEHAARLALLTKQLEEERERNSTVVAQEREDGEARVRAAQEVENYRRYTPQKVVGISAAALRG